MSTCNKTMQRKGENKTLFASLYEKVKKKGSGDNPIKEIYS